jgi:hypothetical protein
MPVVDVEGVLPDPPLDEPEMPAVVALVADSDEDPRGFAGLEDDDDLVGPGAAE